MRAEYPVSRAIAVEQRVGARKGKGRMRAAASTYYGVTPALVERTGKVREKGTELARGERKRSYDHAFLVASIHVSSVTRVMSVGNTRFLESSEAVFSFRPLFPLFYSLPFCPADYSTLFIIVYRRIRARKVKSVSSG